MKTQTLELISTELKRAREKYPGKIESVYVLYIILLKQIEDAFRARTKEAVVREIIQIIVPCVRFLEES